MTRGKPVEPRLDAVRYETLGLPVSMSGWALFECQDAAYRAATIDRTTVRVAIEASVRQGWDRWIAEEGGFVGMTGFGATGPEGELLAHFGITAARAANEVRTRLKGVRHA